jgi:predicted GNAT family acetyltransferase
MRDVSDRRAIAVTDDPDRHRYVVTVDGQEAGVAYYAIRDGVVVFTHTVVDDRWEGQGVGSALARGALDDVVGSGRTFAAHCPFIAAWVGKHPEYASSAVG